MSEDKIGKFISSFTDYLYYSRNREALKQLVDKIKGALQDEEQKNETNVYSDFDKLVELIDNTDCNPALLILKNQNEKFDMFAFKKGITIKFSELASSEEFLKRIRKSPDEGFVISDVEAEDMLNFLKAYYIYRGKPKQVKNAQNITYDYNHKCLEMTSSLEKYDGLESDYNLQLKNIILYDIDVLPYDLNCLDSYYRKNNEYFSDILKVVREDKYIGLKLSPVKRWW